MSNLSQSDIDQASNSQKEEKVQFYEADFVVASGDYHHIEQNLLEPKFRRYDEKYWNSRILSPTCLLAYLGFDRVIKGLEHHNLFFDTDFELHAEEIYENPKWPTEPLFYACCPSKTDPSVAPIGCENVFLLMPLSPNLKDSPEMREKYFQKMIQRMEKNLQTNLEGSIIVKRLFCKTDFENEYFSYKGNAYGLANTLGQTAIFKPKIKSKMKNLYFAGQLTVPGPGLPPSLISGKIVANEIIKKSSRAN